MTRSVLQSVVASLSCIMPQYARAMRVRVLYFAVLRELMGRAEDEVELEAGTSAGELLDLLRAQASNGEIWTRLALAVNREYATRATPLNDGDEVALLPPVSGGR